jgi:hypothetical protein
MVWYHSGIPEDIVTITAPLLKNVLPVIDLMQKKTVIIHGRYI